MSIKQHQNGAKTGTNLVAHSQWSYKGPVLRLYDSSTWTSWWTKGRVAYILRRNCAHVTSLYFYLPCDLPIYLQRANTSSCIVIRPVHKWFRHCKVPCQCPARFKPCGTDNGMYRMDISLPRVPRLWGCQSIKMPSHQHKYSHYKNKTASRPHTANLYT